MIKNTIALLLTITLLSLLAAPVIIIAIDDSADTSMFYSVAEEEEASKIELQAPVNFSNSEHVNAFSSIEAIEYFSKKYPKPHLNLISPPPEFYTL
jgi:hypothetical protein